MSKPSRYTLTLESVPSDVPEVIRLRRLLKALLRAWGFRVVSVAQSPGRPLPIDDDIDASTHEPPF